MRVGILTQKLENNYGGILQNYALQQILLRLGHKPITIDFRPGDNLFWYVVSELKNVFIGLLHGRKLKIEAYSKYKTSRSQLTERFIKERIKTTRRIQFLNPLIPFFYRFDTVIVGSDQVWRLDYNVLRNTFLSFVKGNIRKIAYAASFGVSEWEFNHTQTNQCKKWIKDFLAISVREESGVRLCKDYLNVEAIHVLDPTMLLNREDYVQLCEHVSIKDSDYLFAYVLDITDEKLKTIDRIAKLKGLNVKLLSAEDNISSSIEEWLSHFRDASYIVTDSFHGSVFSIIFRKPFNVFVNISRGSDRFQSLLTQFNLLDRVISPNTTPLTSNIDWCGVSKKTEEQRNISVNFLIDNLKSK